MHHLRPHRTTRPVPRLAVERHMRQMIRTRWELGKRPDFADLKLLKWAHMLGPRSHFSTKFRCYIDALGNALRAAAAPDDPPSAEPVR
ncbi:replication initiator [Kitasatospora sp. NPDC056446]|uniref:replication initiator n=1 Tax=Kitasatospora sp. NPDC056446 TaxID=3345819 RepID=UPI0036821234